MRRSLLLGLSLTAILLLLAAELSFKATGQTHPHVIDCEPRTPILSLPYTITKAGSYYLRSNLTGPGGITIESDNVSIDLNGFELFGGPGAQDGIFVSSAHQNISIRNGTVRAWAESGIDAQSAIDGEFRDLRLLENGGDGIRAGVGGQVNRCLSTSNGQFGIRLSNDAVVLSCTSRNNGSDGIHVDSSSAISESTSDSNGGSGIVCAAHCNVTNSGTRLNSVSGFRIGDSSIVTESSAGDNMVFGFEVNDRGIIAHCTSVANHDAQVIAKTYCYVTDNVCNGREGADDGIRLIGLASRVERNHCTNNDRGIEIRGSDNFVVSNTAIANAVNYEDLGVSSNIGEIITDPGPGFSLCNPYANFSLTIHQ